MKAARTWFWLFAAAFSIPGEAAEIMWLRLHTQMHYRDSSRECLSLRPGGEFLLAAEIEENRPRRVILSNFPYEWPYQWIYKSIALSEEELSRLLIFRDAKGRAWLKHLEVGERALRWILYEPSQFANQCGPPRPVSAAGPAPAVFRFETEDIDLGLLLSYSERLLFRGRRVDGIPFDAQMRIMQTPYTAGAAFP